MKGTIVFMEKKRILLLYDNRELDRQVLKPVNYDSFEEEWIRQNGGNSGNKLYNTAVEQYLTKEDIAYSYYTGEEKTEEINEKYDLAIFTTANIFNANPVVTRQLGEFADLIGEFTIPVYILGCGLQCGSYDEIGSLAKAIAEPARRFLTAIYRTGGELALRGYATKELLDQVMPNTAVVTGCPSFYQRGSGLKISNEKVSEDQFLPAINGNLKYLKQIGMLPVFEQYGGSIYMDQDEFAQILYFHSRNKDDSALELIRKKTLTGVKLLTQDRVKLFYDVPVWLDYFAKAGVSFSCGSRIHGNIAATLAGIPAEVIYRDARTRELAEFFRLPHAQNWQENKTLYEVYKEADYTAFNREFAGKFKVFESFMTEHGISHDLEDRSLFEEKRKQYRWNKPQLIGQKKLDALRKSFVKHEKFYCSYDRILDNARKLEKKVSSLRI